MVSVHYSNTRTLLIQVFYLIQIYSLVRIVEQLKPKRKLAKHGGSVSIWRHHANLVSSSTLSTPNMTYDAIDLLLDSPKLSL